ncbi:MAG: hypothetical protein KDA88_18005 [Planctomycetaceae bacterium]|nr:hypothetical protein [Planctomycetaceae bacterium]MCB9951031.1 hypothetical protein [Planctomycetaceae bacterium]
MSKKYLSLEEAAALLSLRPDELMRLREQGEIRGFADRGNWKFKDEDVQALVRKRQADSDPEVPLFRPEATIGDEISVLDDDDDAPGDVLSSSDSDVRLVGGDMSEDDIDLVLGGDSDVKLVGLDSESEVRLEAPSASEGDVSFADTVGDINLASDSDSDVQLIGSDSDSDIQLVGAGDSDSDVKLVGDGDTVHEMDLDPSDDFALAGASSDAPTPFESGDLTSSLGGDSGSDSDVNLVSSSDDADSDSDVSLLPGDDDAIALDPLGDDGDHASVLADESGISLGGGSSVLLSAESGISLEGASDSGMHLGADDDEGITLALDDDSGISLSSDDSGISLEAADSGISLETIGDSGISLADDDFSGTIPMMDAMDDDDVAETQFEIPSIDDDSEYELSMEDDMADTRTLDMSDMSDEATFDDAEFEFDEADEEESYVSDAFAEDDELELDAGDFDDEEEFVEVDGDVFDTVEEGPEFGPRTRGAAPVESEWGLVEFGLLTVASLFMIACGFVLTDLVKNTATAADPNPVSSTMLDTLGGMYK